MSLPRRVMKGRLARCRHYAGIGVGIIGAIVIQPAAHAEPALPTGTRIEDLFGTVLRNAVWKSPNIAVCWENPSPSDDHQRALVRRAVKETWEAVSLVTFEGWEKCAENESKAVRIRIMESWPRAAALGRFLGGRPSGLILNFSLLNWQSYCATKMDFCIYAIAVHEFGHVLGFSHEQNRDDAPKECREDHHSGTAGDYKVTDYDPNSIMNYCNEKWNGDGKLSELDVEAVQKIYGARKQ